MNFLSLFLSQRSQDHCVSMQVMEVTLTNAFLMFKSNNQIVKISPRTFEQLQPKHICPRHFAQRLQYCCSCHNNIDESRIAFNNPFHKNVKEILFPDNNALISLALCESSSTRCIMHICPSYKSSPKIDTAEIKSLKCSQSCMEENDNSSDHTIKKNQFEYFAYMYKDQEKKKLALQDKMIKISESVVLLKRKLEKFPMDRFIIQHTAEAFDKLVKNLDKNSILKIHDFSENCTCLLTEENQSLQETFTVHLIVVMRKAGADVREGHLVFISDDKKLDVPFVEKSNEILHCHYAEDGRPIKHNIEQNDGYPFQIKYMWAFSSLARRPVKITHIFCETSHGKSKSIRLGGVVKAFATSAVCGERRIIRNAKELTDFFNEMLVVKSAIESHQPMLNWLFLYISSEEMEDYRRSFPSLKYNFIPDTLSIYQVLTLPGKEEIIPYRKGSCGCCPCLNGI